MLVDVLSYTYNGVTAIPPRPIFHSKNHKNKPNSDECYKTFVFFCKKA